MKNPSIECKPARYSAWLLTACAATLLNACGGSAGHESIQPQAEAQLASGATILQLDLAVLPDEAAARIAQPAFHIAPVLLSVPDDADAAGDAASARTGPHRQAVPAEFRGLSTRRLTVQTLESVRRAHVLSVPATSINGTSTPLATGSTVATYSPAQIRAAYGLPALPSAGTTPTAVQAAQMGAGQTIYIVDAMHNPNVAAELAAFNQKFGLPACTAKAIATNASLPLVAASAGGCELSVVYNTSDGKMTGAAPAYDSGWATETALDVQWAHATAPLARIILIEAHDASLYSLVGAVKLANSMGPGVVSMSFGSTEGSWTASVDSVFTAANMTYLAATGDSGAAVAWPSVSANVLAVGGTTLTYSGTDARSEVGWSGTGGGASLYTPRPVYQAATVPGMTTTARSVADVAFNADPSSGQYVAVLSPGSSTVNWISAGGTSIAAPQWAGIVAIANASRALAARPALGAPHSILYGTIASVPGIYASAFGDVAKGAHGSCGTCMAKIGYDQMTGLGTPNGASLLSTLSGASAAATTPVVTSASISGKAGTALSFTISVASANPVSYTLTGAPSGMTVSSTGAVSWAKPATGTYSVTVTARDSKTGLSGQGIYTVIIASQLAPVVRSTSISGKAGAALSFTVSVVASNPVTYTLSSAPSGMAISSTGVITWAKPVTGTYPVTVTARDSKTGLSGKGICTVIITAQQAPVIASASISGKAGTALSFSISVTAPNPVSYAMSGAPSGMAISSSGAVTWAKPVAGTYAVTVTARDSKTGLSGQGVYTVQIAAAAGPVITAPTSMKGIAGQPLTATISISDPGTAFLGISISGAPMGMTFVVSGMTVTASWASPVQGSYNLTILVVDSARLSARTVIPITIAAR